jgi:hypothetical protein
MGIFRVFRGKSRRNFSAVKTCWRRKCDSNSHYRFESRNPRRLRNLQAVQHLTRESTGSDWPLGRLRTVHLFDLSLRRTAYDSVAESGRLRCLGKRPDIGCAMTTCLPRGPKAKNLSAGCAREKTNKPGFRKFLPMLCEATSSFANSQGLIDLPISQT